MVDACGYVQPLLWGEGGGHRPVPSREGEVADVVVFRGVTHPAPL